MKKICVVLHSIKRGGGIQERRAMLVKEWIRQGHSVFVIAPRSGYQDIETFSQYATLENLGMTLKRQRFLPFYLSVKLYSFFRKNNEFDVILTSGVVTNFIVTLSARLAGVKKNIFCTYHNPIKKGQGPVAWLSYKFKSILVKSAAKWSEKFGANSISLARELESITGLKSIKTIYNPVIECEHITYKRAVEDNGSQKKILAVGRLKKQKGFDILIQAIAEIESDARLEIAGDGPLKDELIKLAERLNISERVKFIGFQKDIMSLMRSSDCFVLSSRWEGFGNVLVEALYSQVPIVSFDCDYGPREILENGLYGILVKEKNPQALAYAIDESFKREHHVNTRWKDFTVTRIASEYLNFMNLTEKQEK